MKYAFIRVQCKYHCVNHLCSALNASTSGYYDWLDRPLSGATAKNQRLMTKIRFSRQRVARLMRVHHIQSKMAKDKVWVSDTTFIRTRQFDFIWR